MKKNLLLIAFTLLILSGHSQTLQYIYLNDNTTSFNVTYAPTSGVVDRWMIYDKNSAIIDSVVVSTSTGAITYSRTPVIFTYTTAYRSLTITNGVLLQTYLDSMLIVQHQTSGSQPAGQMFRVVYLYPFVHRLDSSTTAQKNNLTNQNNSLTNQLSRSRDSMYTTTGTNPGYKINYIPKGDTIKTYSRDTTHYEPIIRQLCADTASSKITFLNFQHSTDSISLQNANSRHSSDSIAFLNKHDTVYIASLITSDTLKISIHTGISQTSPTLNSLKIYPNPSSTILHIDLTNPGYFTAKISGITGQTIITPTSGTIDVSGLANGIYILTIYDSNGKLISTNKISIAK